MDFSRCLPEVRLYAVTLSKRKIGGDVYPTVIYVNKTCLPPARFCIAVEKCPLCSRDCVGEGKPYNQMDTAADCRNLSWTTCARGSSTPRKPFGATSSAHGTNQSGAVAHTARRSMVRRCQMAVAVDVRVVESLPGAGAPAKTQSLVA